MADIEEEEAFPYMCALRQVPLRACKRAKHHDRWIVALWKDHTFQLTVLQLDDAAKLTGFTSMQETPYEQLWSTLAGIKLSRGKWWLIGWRTRYAVERGALLNALGRGEVELPPSRSAEKGRKHGGKVTLSSQCVEIDLVCGRNQIKLLDFQQLAILPAMFGLDVGTLTMADSVRTLTTWLEMCERTGLAACKTTAAQMGWARCRSYHLPNALSVNLDDDARALERLAYFNGRTEAFRLGAIPETVYSMDVKSCYAAICREKELPVCMDGMYPFGCPLSSIADEPGTQWIASCIIETDKPDYPLRWGGSPIYPVGTFHTTLAWPELRHALWHGRVRQITCAGKYRSRVCLKGYADWYLSWKEMLRGTPCEQMIPTFKGIFNGSLGYTARRKYEWQPWDIPKGPDWWIGVAEAPDHSEPCVQAQILDGQSRWLSIGGEPYESLPFLHATITSWARVQLLEIMETVGRENVVYVDTDGLLLTQPGMEALRNAEGFTGSLPGQLAERFPPGRAFIGGQKNYRVGKNFVCAGGVHTRMSLLAEKAVLTTTTGLADTYGNVSPFEFTCEDEGDGRARYVNRMA